MNPRGTRKFVFAGIGTKGDLFPLLALGRELVRRGYHAQLLANQGYEELAASHGMGFTPVTVAQTNNLMSVSDNLNGHLFPSYQPTFEYFREQIDKDEAPVVVNLDEYSASNLMCQRYDLPLCRVHLAPNQIRSIVRPPFPYNKRVEGRLRATYRKHRLPQFYAQRTRPANFIVPLNRFRQQLGLSPVVSTEDIDAAVTQRLGFFPSWYAPPASDWPARFELVGFPLPPSSNALPREFMDFVWREGRPVVFTPGTGVVDVAGFFEDAKRCCEALGLPGVFLSRHFRVPDAGLGSRIIHFPFIDLKLVLEHTAALVHHGGIGTTARAFEAGVPQIIRPMAYDQFDNGDRVQSLGVGRSLLPEDYSPQKLFAAVGELTCDVAVQPQLQRFAQMVRSQDAILLAADVLERLAQEQAAPLPFQRSRRVTLPTGPSLPTQSGHAGRRRKAKFILSSLGTLGDLLPMLALAKELVDRGHPCHMLGNAAAADCAAELGIEFSAVSPAISSNLLSKETFVSEYVFPSYEPTFRIFERELALGNDLVVVNRGGYSATMLMCEHYRLPQTRVYLAPAHVRSLAAPPLPWKARTTGKLGLAFKKYRLPKIYEDRDRDAYILRPFNAYRAAFRLAPIGSFQELEPGIDYRLGFFPEWYAQPASDWPALDLVGFPLAAASGDLPPDLSSWIQGQGRPLVFTPGTGICEVDHFFTQAQRCCELLDKPGVFLSPHYRPDRRPSSQRMRHFDFLALGSLLPHAALLVHHGGIGTTARALQAGIPQIVSPQAYDQPDNGGRVVDLGVGAVIQRELLSGETLASAAGSLLRSEHVATTSRRLAHRIARTPAIAHAADQLLQRFVHAPRSSAVA